MGNVSSDIILDTSQDSDRFHVDSSPPSNNLLVPVSTSRGMFTSLLNDNRLKCSGPLLLSRRAYGFDTLVEIQASDDVLPAL